MRRINKAEILTDFKRNWFAFALILALGSYSLVRSEYRVPVIGPWIFIAVLVLAIAGLIVRYAWRGWLEFGRD